jgi:hypothetical protein
MELCLSLEWDLVVNRMQEPRFCKKRKGKNGCDLFTFKSLGTIAEPTIPTIVPSLSVNGSEIINYRLSKTLPAGKTTRWFWMNPRGFVSRKNRLETGSLSDTHIASRSDLFARITMELCCGGMDLASKQMHL